MEIPLLPLLLDRLYGIHMCPLCCSKCYVMLCACALYVNVHVLCMYFCENIWLLIKDRDWTDYWRILFKKVTVDDIRAFEKSYKGSEEESETLRSAYVNCEGDMDKILEEVCELYHSVYTSV